MILMNVLEGGVPEPVNPELVDQALQTFNFVKDHQHLAKDPSFSEMFKFVADWETANPEEAKKLLDAKYAAYNEASKGPGNEQGTPLDENGQFVLRTLQFIEQNPKELERDPKLKEFKDKYDADVAAATAKAEAAKTTPAAADPAKPADATTDKPATEPIVSVKTTLFGDETETDKPADKPKTFTSIDELKAYSKQVLGDIEDPFELVKETTRLRQLAKDTEDATKQVAAYEGIFKNMPPALYAGIEASLKGENWQKVTKELIPEFDISKDFKEQDKFAIVNHFFPNKFSKEDVDKAVKGEIDANEAITGYIELAEQKFGVLKQAYVEKYDKITNEAKSTAEKFKNSVTESIADFQRNYPKLGENHIMEVNKFLSGKLFHEIFLEKDGSYKKDAAEKAALLLYGKQDLITLRETLKKTNAELRKTVDAKSDKPDIPGKMSVATQPRVLSNEYNGLVKRNHFDGE